MKSGVRLIGSALLAGVLGYALPGTILSAAAQNVRDARVDLYPPGTQVGIVTAVNGKTAWVRLPHAAQVGSKVEFSAFSDSADMLAAGQVKWISPVAPYEAYVTDIEARKTRHNLNDYEDTLALGALFKIETARGAVPFSEPYAGPLASGFFARVPVFRAAEDMDGVEPVRAYIGALRNQKNKTATAIAVAAERALVADPQAFETDVTAEEAVNFTMLEDNLRHFRRISISDPVTQHVFARLIAIARANGGSGGRVAKDILRVTAPLRDDSSAAGYTTPR
jgi:hypothetical protein